MFYEANASYRGGYEFKITAENEAEAKEKARSYINDSIPESLINNVTENSIEYLLDAERVDESLFKVNIKFDGGCRFEVEASSLGEANQKAQDLIEKLLPEASADDGCGFVEHDLFYNKIKDVVLTNDEYNALQKISSATKMDCWFCLVNDEEVDYVRDLENDEKMSLVRAIGQLIDGMVEPVEDEFYGLTQDEIMAFKNLIKNLGL